MNIFKNMVDAANAVSSNVWAFLALCIGVFLAVKKIPLGEQMIMASFALLRTAGSTTTVQHADEISANVKVNNA